MLGGIKTLPNCPCSIASFILDLDTSCKTISATRSLNNNLGRQKSPRPILVHVLIGDPERTVIKKIHHL